jgi:hypothetical protein
MVLEVLIQEMGSRTTAKSFVLYQIWPASRVESSRIGGAGDRAGGTAIHFLTLGLDELLHNRSPVAYTVTTLAVLKGLND